MDDAAGTFHCTHSAGNTPACVDLRAVIHHVDRSCRTVFLTYTASDTGCPAYRAGCFPRIPAGAKYPDGILRRKQADQMLRAGFYAASAAGTFFFVHSGGAVFRNMDRMAAAYLFTASSAETAVRARTDTFREGSKKFFARRCRRILILLQDIRKLRPVRTNPALTGAADHRFHLSYPGQFIPLFRIFQSLL